MPRNPTLQIKHGSWYTKAGNTSGHYFGPVKKVSRQDAQGLFADYLKLLSCDRAASNQDTLTVLKLCELFLDWVQKNRGDRTYEERRRHLQMFCKHHAGSQRIADLSATAVQALDLQSFLDSLKKTGENEEKRGSYTIDKYATSIKAVFNWGVKHPSPVSYLPQSFRPFSSIEKYRRPPEPLLEDELPTKAEIGALLNWADADLAPVREGRRYRQRRPDEYRQGEANPYRGFGDVLRVYWHTGARTSELAKWRVRDFVRVSRQIVLGKHKRSETMREPVARRVTLNDEAFAIIQRCCEGKESEAPIFTTPNGKAWTRTTLDHRFDKVRNRAGVRGEITIYSFRHLWISEALMVGMDIATVAKMAGTSIAMIERIYGHFRSSHLQQAQQQLDAIRQKSRLIA